MSSTGPIGANDFVHGADGNATCPACGRNAEKRELNGKPWWWCGACRLYEGQPTDAPPPSPFPEDLFRENVVNAGKANERRELSPEKFAFAEWFRSTETFAVPIEHETFGSSNRYELLHYEKTQGYYNGTAKAFITGRVEAAFRYWKQASSITFRNEIMGLMSATEEYHRQRSVFNPQDKLCLRNGILDLNTFTTSPHDPQLVFTWQLPVAYDPEATCPTFDAYLDCVQPEPKKRELVLDLLGYCLWRRNPFQQFYTLVGDGHNGKTVFLETLKALVGDKAVSAQTLQSLANNRFSPAALEGKLINICDDLPYDQRLRATGVLKMLTGEGTLPGEKKFQAPFEFKFDGKLVSAANRTPPVDDDTYAFWRRAQTIPFEVTVPESMRDSRLLEKLKAELPGILNRALDGLRRVQKRSVFDPERVFGTSQDEWRRRADPIRRFVDETLTIHRTLEVSAERLYHAYQDWCAVEDTDALKRESFGKKIRDAIPHCERVRHRDGEKLAWFYTGAGLKGEGVEIDENGPPAGSSDLDRFLPPQKVVPSSPDCSQLTQPTTPPEAHPLVQELSPQLGTIPPCPGWNHTLTWKSIGKNSIGEVSTNRELGTNAPPEGSENAPKTPLSPPQTPPHPHSPLLSGSPHPLQKPSTYPEEVRALAWSRVKEHLREHVGMGKRFDPKTVEKALIPTYEEALVKETLQRLQHDGLCDIVFEDGKSWWIFRAIMEKK